MSLDVDHNILEMMLAFFSKWKTQICDEMWKIFFFVSAVMMMMLMILVLVQREERKRVVAVSSSLHLDFFVSALKEMEVQIGL